MVTHKALISSDVLRWACERAHVTVAVLAEKVSKKAPLWLSGEEKPSFPQAQKVADLLHIPFGYLFLTEPPQESMLLPDLRTVGNKATGEISLELRETIADAKKKQTWYEDYARVNGLDDVPFIGAFSAADGWQVIAHDMIQMLGIDEDLRQRIPNRQDLFASICRRADDLGVLVMHNGVVGNNNYRPLCVNEFRGFAISSATAPLIFINWRDAEAARLFTLVHELVHLWLDCSGVSSVDATVREPCAHSQIEALCNAVAAEVLVPKRSLVTRWNSHQSIEANTASLRSHYHVSAVVIARKAFDLGLIAWDDYQDFYQAQTELWQTTHKKNGGHYHRNIASRVGNRFANAVITSTQQGTTLYRDAGRLLGVKPPHIQAIAKEVGL